MNISNLFIHNTTDEHFCCFQVKNTVLMGTSSVVQWVRLHAPNTGSPGSIPGWGIRSCMHAATKSSHAATKKPACCK